MAHVLQNIDANNNIVSQCSTSEPIPISAATPEGTTTDTTFVDIPLVSSTPFFSQSYHMACQSSINSPCSVSYSPSKMSSCEGSQTSFQTATPSIPIIPSLGSSMSDTMLLMSHDGITCHVKVLQSHPATSCKVPSHSSPVKETYVWLLHQQNLYRAHSWWKSHSWISYINSSAMFLFICEIMNIVIINCAWLINLVWEYCIHKICDKWVGDRRYR